MNITKFISSCNYKGKPLSDFVDSENTIFCNILKRCLSIFKIENLPETLNERVLLLSFFINESYGILENKGVLRNVYGGYSGTLDFYGYPTEYLWSTGVESGNTKLSDMVVGHSNKLWFPIVFIIDYYSRLLANMDVSLRIASVNTRTVDIYRATTDVDQKRINKIFDDIECGKVNHAFLTDMSLDKLLKNDTGLIPFTSKSGDSQYIPMLLQAYDSLFARMCREIGINISVPVKKAQVNSLEIYGYENYSQLCLSEMLDSFKEFFDNVNEKYGTDISVKLNQAFLDDSPENGTVQEMEQEENEEQEEQEGSAWKD